MPLLENGGLIANKGFSFQFDQTIKYLLENQGSEIYFESNQDIDFDNTVLQIKNHEKSKYMHSRIRKPLLQLIDCYSEDNTKKYILYAHFYDQTPQSKTITISILNKILGKEKNKISTTIKQGFIENFTLELAGNYEDNYIIIINLIKITFGCNEDEAKIKRDLIVQFFKKRLYENPNSTVGRKTSFIEISSYLSSCNNTVFWGEYEKKLGQDKYEEALLKKVKRLNFWRQPTLLYFGLFNYNGLEDCVNFIASKSKANKRILIICEDLESIKTIKVNLLAHSLSYNDGFSSESFNYNLFKQYHLSINKEHSNISLISKDEYLHYETMIRSDLGLSQSIIFNDIAINGIGDTKYIHDIDGSTILSLFRKLI